MRSAAESCRLLPASSMVLPSSLCEHDSHVAFTGRGIGRPCMQCWVLFLRQVAGMCSSSTTMPSAVLYNKVESESEN